MRGAGECSGVRGVVDLRGTPVVRLDLAKWSIGCLDLATFSCRQTLLLDSQLLSLGVFATTHPHQLAILVGNVEAFVLAADCERCPVVRRECAQSRSRESTEVQPRRIEGASDDCQRPRHRAVPDSTQLGRQPVPSRRDAAEKGEGLYSTASAGTECPSESEEADGGGEGRRGPIGRAVPRSGRFSHQPMSSHCHFMPTT